MSEQPTGINQTLWQVLDSLQITDEIGSRIIKESWEKILGATLATNAEYVGFHDSILTIKVVHPAWQKEFKQMEHELITKINTHLGTKLISKIQILSPTFGDKKIIKKGRGQKKVE